MLQIAVIGGGAAGLAAASYLIREENIHVTLFEERSEYGGVWTNRATRVQTNPMYDGLETNVPHTLMTFTDHKWPKDTPVFPPHEQVRTYLRTFAEKKLLRSQNLTCLLSQRVVDLRQVSRGSWKIITKGLYTDIEGYFDGVVIAAGNHNKAHITDEEEGRADWIVSGCDVTHSSDFKNAECYTKKNVLVVGNGPSGWDITERVAKVAKSVVVSVRSLPATVNPGATRAAGLIREYDHSTRTVRFHQGAQMKNVDAVIYCTGYKFDFPFIIKNDRSQAPLFPTGFRVEDLYKHMFYLLDPSLAFVGLPKMAATFIVAEAQSAIVARVFSGRIELPRLAAMTAWRILYESRHISENRSEANFHTLSTRSEEDKAYVNELQEWASLAEDQNAGKPPPYWCNCLDEAKLPLRTIREAFKAHGDESYQCTRYSQLGGDLSIPCPKRAWLKYPPGTKFCFLDPASR